MSPSADIDQLVANIQTAARLQAASVQAAVEVERRHTEIWRQKLRDLLAVYDATREREGAAIPTPLMAALESARAALKA